MEDNNIQDFKSWILLALFVFRCLSAGKSLYPLSEVCWQTKIVVIAPKTYCSKCFFPAMGSRFYRGDKSIFLGQHRWILTAIDFFTKWVEAIPTRNATYKVIMEFIEENILSRFGCPQKIVTNNAKAFKSKAMEAFCEKNGILLKHSTPYYPQGNGLAESSK